MSLLLALTTSVPVGWSLDGRDPASTAGGAWVLGRHDRPFGPERPVFGTVRYLTSTSPARRRFFRAYVARWTS